MVSPHCSLIHRWLSLDRRGWLSLDWRRWLNLDRRIQVISLLKPTLERVFAWTETDYSHVVMAFQGAYALSFVAFGWGIDRIGTKIGYSLSVFVWSGAAMLHAVASSTFGFGVFRALLGLGEGGNFPAAIKTVTEWFPQKERVLATGIFNSGTNIGAVVAPVLVPWLLGQYGWQSAFLVTGAERSGAERLPIPTGRFTSRPSRTRAIRR